jgi:hypothetical protein
MHQRPWEALDDAMAITDSPFNRALGLSLVGAVIARAGLADSARTVTESARAKLPVDHPEAAFFHYYLAYVSNLVGDLDRALLHLDSLIAQDPPSAQFLPVDWWFRDLWDQPGFLALLEKHGGT